VRDARSVLGGDPKPAEKLPEWITPELIAEARETMQEMGEEELTTDDIVGLLQSMGGVFEFLYGTGEGSNEGEEQTEG
jgi:hypothetical protein